jgi:hypothetical protein
MSSSVVRSAFRNAIVAQFPAVEYVETLGTNVDNEDLPALWMTAGFAAMGQERLCIGHPSYWEENGVVRILVAGESGSGDGAVVTQADAVVNYFRNWQVPAEMLRVTGVQPPSDTEDESDGKWLFVSVDVFYTRGFYA